MVQQRAREVEAAGEEEVSGDDDVVALQASSATAEVPAPPAKKSKKTRKSKIWNPTFDLMLARKGEFSCLR